MRVDCFCSAGCRKGLEGLGTGGPGHKKEAVFEKTLFFAIEKHIEDVKQDPKTVPDLVESRIRPTRFEKRRVTEDVDENASI